MSGSILTSLILSDGFDLGLPSQLPKAYSPLEPIYEEIAGALDAKLYYLALVSTVTIPDICVCLESGAASAQSKKYKEWFTGHVAKYYKHFGAEECYEIRCGVVHEAVLKGSRDKLSPYKKFYIQLPNSDVRAHQTVGKNPDGSPAVGVDLVRFCLCMIGGARAWEASVIDNEMVQKNLERVIRYRPDGWAPFIEPGLMNVIA